MATPIYALPEIWETGKLGSDTDPIARLLLEIYNQTQGIAAGTVAGNPLIISSTNFVPVTTGAECTAALNFAIANLRSIGYTVTDFNTWSYYDANTSETIFAWTIKYEDSEELANVITTFDVTAGDTAAFTFVDGGTAIIDWGDGTIEEIVTGTITHTYPGHTGVFEIRIFSDTLESLTGFTADQFGNFTINSDTITEFAIDNGSLVEELTLNCPALETLNISSAPLSGATTFDLSGFPALQSVKINDCPSITNLDFTNCPLLTLIYCKDSPALASVNITGLLLIENFAANNDILPVSNINSILAALVASGVANGTCTINNQTPAAAPTGQGIVDAAALVTDGWTVTTD